MPSNEQFHPFNVSYTGFTLISVISLIGGLALGVYRPLLLIIHYFTSRHYFARIIRELYAVRQSTNEFIKANKIENSNNLHNSN
jgi:hypothetical protein